MAGVDHGPGLQEEGRGHDPRPEITLSRRQALQAGAIGAAALATKSALKPGAAWGAATQDAAPSGPGVYELNQDWLFGGVYAAGAEAPGASEASFTTVTLPHLVTPLSWGNWDHTTWEQVWIYRRHLPQWAPSAGRVFVDFDGVMTSATVYLNGIKLGTHQGGFLPWSVELTDGLVAADNVLAVVVDGTWQDVPPGGKIPSGGEPGAWTIDYLMPAGVYRDVRLRLVPQVFIADVFAKPTNVLNSPGLDVAVTINAGSVPSGPVSVTAQLLDGTTKLAQAQTTATLSTSGDNAVTLTISGLSGLTLWSPENPKLYQVSVTIVAGGVSHSLQVNTGFRDATFKDDGFYLNGERYEIFGLNRHQLFPYSGMGAPERLQRRDVALLKDELNCNMVRCSHYPQSPYFLDACDELGLMVWEEPPGWQYIGDAAFQDIVVQNVNDMVIRDRNRPSVIVWATRLNESADEPALYAQTRQLAYTLDGSRQTTGAVDYQNTSQWAEDVYAYDDYHTTTTNNVKSATLEPPISGVPYMISEAVGALDGAPLYRWIDSDATLAIQATMHAQVHNIAQADPSGYAGLLGWAGFDYASLSGGNRIWNNIKWPGVIDTFRVLKLGAAFYQSQVDPSARPVIAPVFFWDFGSSSPSNPGSNAMIATNCDELRLFVNGTQVVTGTSDHNDYGSLAYPPVFVDLSSVSGSGSPELRIDGYVNGTKVTSVSMSSDTTKDTLELAIEAPSIQGDGTDATRFTIRSLDKYGNQRPYPSGDVNLTITGPATLVADNPFPFATLGGVGGGFIRSQPGTSGTVTLTASHPTLGQVSQSLMVTAASTGASGPAVCAPTVVGVAPVPPSSGSSGSGIAGSSSPVPTSPPVAAQNSSAVARSTVRAALAAILRPRGAAARIRQIVSHGGYTLSFKAPAGGKLVVDWYFLPRGDHHAKHHEPERVLVASMTASPRRAGVVRLKLRLTRRGRALLRSARHERLTADASFTPTGQPKVSMSRTINLNR